MTVDIARMDTNAIAVLGGANDALERLGQWVTAASQAHRLVAGLVDTAFIPDSYKPKFDPRATPQEKAAAREIAIGNATAAVLQGVTLGIDPLMALQQIYIIHGRPGMYAKMMVALVQSRGHDVWTEDLSDSRAVVCGRRAGTEHVERVAITMDQARKAAWTKNEAYTKTPQDMLWARAAARVCDRIASDVLKGIASVEEVQDTIKAEAAVVGNGSRTVSRRQPTAAVTANVQDDDPPLDDESPAPAPLTSPSDPARHASEREPSAPPDSNVAAQGQAEPGITAAQQKKMHALLNETGRGDREVGLVFIAGIIGREIASTKELTKREAIRVIDALDIAPEPTLDEQDWSEAAQPPDGTS
jgi:hypothetical protein